MGESPTVGLFVSRKRRLVEQTDMRLSGQTSRPFEPNVLGVGTSRDR